jgi:hypothetical protein
MITFNRVQQLDARGNTVRQSRIERNTGVRTRTDAATLTRSGASTSTDGKIIDTTKTTTTPAATTVPGNPFSGQNGPQVSPAPVYSAPTIAPPPAMTNRPGSISLGTTVDSVISNSARSVQLSNHAYNEQAYESYNKAVSEWQANNGRRWVGNQFVQTTVPPPTPDYLSTDFGEIYSDITANYQNGRPYEDVNAKRPYYMGGSVFIKS